MKGLFAFVSNGGDMDTDRTQVKGGHSDLPVALSGPMVPEAHQRAPTLMAGARGGGEVRIWAPSRLPVWANCGLWSLGFVLAFGLIVRDVLVGHGELFLHSLMAIWSALNFLALLLRRPRYASTDASGIAITTDSSSAAISWADIQSIRCCGTSVTFFRLGDNMCQSGITLDLAAYPKRSNKALVQLVIVRADLYQSPFHSNEFLNLAEMARRGLGPRSTHVRALAGADLVSGGEPAGMIGPG